MTANLELFQQVAALNIHHSMDSIVVLMLRALLHDGTRTHGSALFRWFSPALLRTTKTSCSKFIFPSKRFPHSSTSFSGWRSSFWPCILDGLRSTDPDTQLIVLRRITLLWQLEMQMSRKYPSSLHIGARLSDQLSAAQPSALVVESLLWVLLFFFLWPKRRQGNE